MIVKCTCTTRVTCYYCDEDHRAIRAALAEAGLGIDAPQARDNRPTQQELFERLQGPKERHYTPLSMLKA